MRSFRIIYLLFSQRMHVLTYIILSQCPFSGLLLFSLLLMLFNIKPEIKLATNNYY